MPINVAILYYSGYGHTKALAEEIKKGVDAVDDAEATLILASDLPKPDDEGNLGGRWQELHDADAIIFGSPTYMGSAAAGLKQAFETTSSFWFRQAWRDKIAAGFTNSGGMSGDKLETLSQFAVFAGQHGMIWVNPGIYPSNQEDGEDSDLEINRVGAWMGFMAQSGNAPPDQTPPEADRVTARRFGARIAEATKRWVAGAPKA